nr:MAG TPA: hypothetical protein [Caudoviricetes sp.]
MLTLRKGDISPLIYLKFHTIKRKIQKFVLIFGNKKAPTPKSKRFKNCLL